MLQNIDVQDDPVLARIPTPQEVRNRLGQSLREVRILRNMLKLAEQVEQERENRKAVAHAVA